MRKMKKVVGMFLALFVMGGTLLSHAAEGMSVGIV